MKSVFSLLTGILILLSAWMQNVQAQFSWRPKPYPECKIFAVTEVGIFYRISSLPQQHLKVYGDAFGQLSPIPYAKGQYYLTSDLGFMLNMNNRLSMGLVHYVGVFTGNDGGGQGGFKFRVRRWFTNRIAMDFSTGILLWETTRFPISFKTPGFTGSIDLKYRDLIGFSVMFEYFQPKITSRTFVFRKTLESVKYDNDLAVYFGIKSGSTPGSIGNVIAGVVALFLYFLAYGRG